MLKSESFWDEFEIEIEHADEISTSERKLISDYPKFELNHEGLTNMRIIFDSGCTSHICSELEMFDTIYDERGLVRLPDKNTVRYEGKGTIGFLKDVLCIPGVNGMYISCGQLDQDGMNIQIGSGKLTVSDEYGNPICTGIKIKGLYHLEDIGEMNSVDEIRGSAPRKLRISSGKMKKIDLLHHRLGHQSEDSIKEGLKRGSWIGLGMDPEELRKEDLSYCPDCYKGKMKSIPERSSETDYSNLGPLEHMSTDSKGPFRIPSREGHFKYFDLFVFRSSHYLIESSD